MHLLYEFASNIQNTTKIICDSFSDSRIKYIKNEKNLGAFGNMNRGIQLASNEFIVLLHDDDLLLENYLSTMKNALSTNEDIDMIFPDKKVIVNEKKAAPKSGIYKIVNTLRKILTIDNALIKIRPEDFFIHNIVSCPVGVMFRKSRALKLGSFKENLYPIADYIFWTDYSFDNDVYFLPKEIAVSRQGDNITHSKGMFERLFRECYKFQKSLLESDVVKGSLAEAYLYESIKIKNNALVFKTESNIDLDDCYRDLTGDKYRLNMIRSLKSYVYLMRFTFSVIFRLIFQKTLLSRSHAQTK